MQQTDPDISPSEWRWVIVFSGLLVAATLLPYIWAFALNVPPDRWQFMGMLANHIDGATYISKIGEGINGQWLFTLNYTAEPHTGVAINEFYLLLGHIAGLLHIPALMMYHLARLVDGFIMYVSIYYLGASIWNRQRARRLFFSILAVGSGLGWLIVIFNASLLPSDLNIPESIPLFAIFTNPHFPLAIALIALLASIYINVFRPGFSKFPDVTNGGIGVILVTIALCIVQPQGWVPIAAALCLYIGITAVRTRRIPNLELAWVALAILPAIPFFVYYFVVSQDKGLFQSWSSQNVTPSPSPLAYFLGFGLILLIALPGIWRGVRHFERDGDRFMIIWLLSNFLLLYAPLSLQRRLAIGLIIPLVYFAVRSLEDYWFYRISPRWRDAALVAVFVFIVPSNALSFMIPLFGVSNPKEGLSNAMLLPVEYVTAITWLNNNTPDGSIVLASPQASLWIPAYTTDRVVYGHPFETVNSRVKLEEVKDYYRGRDCSIPSRYGVNYILAGSLEQNLNFSLPSSGYTVNTFGCLTLLKSAKPLAQFGTLQIYATAP
jgi:hypothetical protein